MATKPKTTEAGRRAMRLSEMENAVLGLQQGILQATAQEIMTAVLSLLYRGAFHDGMSAELLRHIEETEGPEAAAKARAAGEEAVATTPAILTPAQYRRKFGPATAKLAKLARAAKAGQ